MLTRSRQGSPNIPRSQFDVAIVYERKIDVIAERERLTKDIAKFEKGLPIAERQLGNPGFSAKAPAHIVEGLKKQGRNPASAREVRGPRSMRCRPRERR